VIQGAGLKDAPFKVSAAQNPGRYGGQSIVCDGHDPEGNVFQLRENEG
jgi:hypothetical protein